MGSSPVSLGGGVSLLEWRVPFFETSNVELVALQAPPPSSNTKGNLTGPRVSEERVLAVLGQGRKGRGRPPLS